MSMRMSLLSLSVRPRARRGRFSPFAKIVLFAFIAEAVYFGGAKTNAPPRSVAGPIVQSALSEAERMAANWNVRGAWKDWVIV